MSQTPPEPATGSARAGAIEAAGLDSSDPAHWALAIVGGIVEQDGEPYVQAPWPRPERPPPFEHPLLQPMSPEDQIPEGESILTSVPKLPLAA